MSGANGTNELILFFDGACGLCGGTVAFVRGRDRRRAFRFEPLQGELAAAMLGREKASALDTVALLDEGRVYEGADAVLRAAFRLGGPWRVLASFGRCVPRGLRDAVYRFVARNRRRL